MLIHKRRNAIYAICRSTRSLNNWHSSFNLLRCTGDEATVSKPKFTFSFCVWSKIDYRVGQMFLVVLLIQLGSLCVLSQLCCVTKNTAKEQEHYN